MPDPTGFTEWGYLGGLIFTVVSFLVYLWRRDQAAAKREKTMQDFFAKLYSDGRDATEELTRAIKELLENFQKHDKETAAAIAAMKERTANKRTPARKAAD